MGGGSGRRQAGHVTAGGDWKHISPARAHLEVPVVPLNISIPYKDRSDSIYDVGPIRDLDLRENKSQLGDTSELRL